MPDEHAPISPMANQHSVGPAPAATPVSAMGKVDKASSLKFSEHSDFNFPMLILWLAAAFSILVTVYFWWSERDLESAVADKKQALTAVEGNLFAKSNTDVEKEANDFKASVSALSNAYKQRYSFTTFLPNFYKKINKDVVINDLTISADGSVALTGTTTSYRSIADQVMSLKTSSDLDQVDLASTSVSSANGGSEFSFTIKANLVKNSPANSSAQTSQNSGTTNQTATGGNQ